MSRVIVVSNRLPLTLRKEAGRWTGERSTGGLVTALGPLVARSQGLWVGWPGEAPEGPDPARQALLDAWTANDRLVAVDLSRRVAQKFYLGYANRTLWPLFHSFPSRFDFEPEGWDAYAEANRRFRDTIVRHAQPGDVVWIHDYHLMLLPQLLREAMPSLRIGFFLHIPFPPADLFRVLPRREDLLRGLLGADLVGFHTHSYLRHFRTAVLRVLGISSDSDRLSWGNRGVRLGAFPIGIVTEEFLRPLESDPEVAAEREELTRRFDGQRILLGVDRLDYTKGIPERLRAYRRLLESAPRLRGTVCLVQVAVPSRGDIPRYRDLSDEVSRLVGEVNGAFGTATWTPVHYIRRGVSRANLVALYASAAVGWVTPLRDGMNLVAKEYVTCQTSLDGVLVLSELAGAAAEMGEALLVNPYDEQGTAETIEQALAMEGSERRRRMESLRRRVLLHDAAAWSAKYLTALNEAGVQPPAPGAVPISSVHQAFIQAHRRLVVLDYDGTLVPLRADPAHCAPSAEVVSQLARLTALAGTRVAVVSGRSRHQLMEWLGSVPDLWLAAEHGAYLRAPEAGQWEMARGAGPLDWKAEVRRLLDEFVELAAGSFVEEKECSLAWHYRRAEPEHGERLSRELLVTLDGLLADTDARAIRGHKVVEVRPVWVSKGAVVGWLAASDAFGFHLAIGDDRTDEDLFARMPEGAWTVRVGAGASRARYRLPSTSEVEVLLSSLCGATALPTGAPCPAGGQP